MIRKKIILLIYAAFITFFVSTKVSAATTERIAGNDRYDTAIEISQKGWDKGSKYVVLVNGENFPDALCATPLAKKYDAPILLNPGSKLDSRVEKELKRLGTKEIYIIGGIGVVPDTVKDDIEKIGIKTTRLAGQNRYETSVKVAEQINFNGEIAITSGENFQDAVSIAPIAAKRSMPVLLSTEYVLPDCVKNYMSSRTMSKVYLIGQPMNFFSDIPNSERVFLSDGYSDNVEVLKRFEKDIDFSKIYIANGDIFADSLAGSALAAKNSSAILLVGNSMDKLFASELTLLKLQNLSNINILGGTDVVSDDLFKTILYPDPISIKEIKTNLSLSTAEDKNNIYYSSPSISLSKYNKAGTEKQKLSDKTANSLFVDETWVYFVYNNTFYKVKKDGTSETKIKELSQISNGSTDIIAVKNNKIYYNVAYGDKSNLTYRIGQVSLDDGSDKVLDEDSSYSSKNFVFANNSMYYLQDTSHTYYNRIVKIDLNTLSKTTQLDVSNYINDFVIQNNTIYYVVVDNTIKKLSIKKLDGNDTKYVDDLMSTDNTILGRYLFTVSDGWIYYSSYTGGINKVKVDGNSKTHVADTGINEYIFVKDGYIYFNTITINPDGGTREAYKMKLDGSGKEKIDNSIITELSFSD